MPPALPSFFIKDGWKEVYKGARFKQVGYTTTPPQIVLTPRLCPTELPYLLNINLPASSYHLAPQSVEHLDKGVAKYQGSVPYANLTEFYSLVCHCVDLPETHAALLAERVNQKILVMLDGISSAYKPPSVEFVLERMVHDPNGDLRTETSAGFRFEYRRKQLAKRFPASIVEFLLTFDCSLDIFAIAFLKEEMRPKIKDTRSIMVFQIYLWLIFTYRFGWLYQFFETSQQRVIAYGHRCDSEYFTNKLASFQPGDKTHSFDLTKQDSRFNVIFLEFLESFIFTRTNCPQSERDYLSWIHNQSFYNKRLVTREGDVLTFTNGELSGFPGTILYNSLYSLWIMTVASVAYELQNKLKVHFHPLSILGDDVLVQFDYKSEYELVCELLGHVLTHHEGKLTEVPFLSYKFRLYGGRLYPYYENLDKMFASLRYCKDTVSYFQKCCSFLQLLAFSPVNSVEHKWAEQLEMTCLTMMRKYHTSLVNQLNCFKSISAIRSHDSEIWQIGRGGWKYQSRPTMTTIPLKQHNHEINQLKNQLEAQKAKAAKAQQSAAQARNQPTAAKPKPKPAKKAKPSTPAMTAKVIDNNQAYSHLIANSAIPTSADLTGIPSEVPTEVLPQWTQGIIELPVDPLVNHGAIVFNPSIRYPISFMRNVTPGTALTSGIVEKMHNISDDFPNTKGMTISTPFHGDDVVLKPVEWTTTAYGHYTNIGHTKENGMRYIGDFSGTDSIVVQMKNTSNVPLNVSAFCICFSDANTFTRVDTGGGNLAPGAFLTSNAMDISAQNRTYGIAFGYFMSAAIDRSMEVSVPSTLTVGQTWVWEPLSFMIGDADQALLLEALDESTYHRITGFAVVVTNNTADMFKSGVIAGAEFRGGSHHELPNNPQGIFKKCATSKSKHTMQSTSLSTGASYVWCPEKKQDTWFTSLVTAQNDFLYSPTTLPYGAVAYSTTVGEQFAANLSVKVYIKWELLTNSNVFRKFVCPMNLGIMTEIYNTLNERSRLNSNDGHIQYLEKVVTSFLRNPTVRRIAKVSLKTAGGLISIA